LGEDILEEGSNQENVMTEAEPPPAREFFVKNSDLITCFIDAWPGSGIRSTTPRSEGDQMPYSYQDDSTDECPDNGDTIYIDVANTRQHYDIRQQPGTHESSDDSTDDTERESPANDGFCNDTNYSCNKQVNDDVKAKGPDVIADFNSNAIG
jgi:hypothetical protein